MSEEVKLPPLPEATPAMLAEGLRVLENDLGVVSNETLVEWIYAAMAAAAIRKG